MHATFQAIWCFTHITSFNPHNKYMSKVSGSPCRDEKTQVPGSLVAHTYSQTSLYRCSPKKTHLVRLQIPISCPLFYRASKNKISEIFIFSLALEFLELWIVVLGFKCQNFHFQKWPEIPYWLHKENSNQGFSRVFWPELTISSTN